MDIKQNITQSGLTGLASAISNPTPAGAATAAGTAAATFVSNVWSSHISKRAEKKARIAAMQSQIQSNSESLMQNRIVEGQSISELQARTVAYGTPMALVWGMVRPIEGVVVEQANPYLTQMYSPLSNDWINRYQHSYIVSFGEGDQFLQRLWYNDELYYDINNGGWRVNNYNLTATWYPGILGQTIAAKDYVNYGVKPPIIGNVDLSVVNDKWVIILGWANYSNYNGQQHVELFLSSSDPNQYGDSWGQQGAAQSLGYWQNGWTDQFHARATTGRIKSATAADWNLDLLQLSRIDLLNENGGNYSNPYSDIQNSNNWIAGGEVNSGEGRTVWDTLWTLTTKSLCCIHGWNESGSGAVTRRTGFHTGDTFLGVNIETRRQNNGDERALWQNIDYTNQVEAFMTYFGKYGQAHEHRYAFLLPANWWFAYSDRITVQSPTGIIINNSNKPRMNYRGEAVLCVNKHIQEDAEIGSWKAEVQRTRQVT